MPKHEHYHKIDNRDHNKQRLPGDHFNYEGVSGGKHGGPERSTPDAHNTNNPKREERQPQEKT